MGIVIRYSGKLADPSLVREFEQELGEFCREKEWRHYFAREQLERSPFPVDVHGLSLVPWPGAELVHFHVSPDGRLVNLLEYARAFAHIATRALHGGGRCLDPPRDAAEEHLFRLSPTAYALRYDMALGDITVNTLQQGSYVHVAVCEALDFVKRRHIPDLDVHDDTGYFQHRDPERLAASMALALSGRGERQVLPQKRISASAEQHEARFEALLLGRETLVHNATLSARSAPRPDSAP